MAAHCAGLAFLASCCCIGVGSGVVGRDVLEPGVQHGFVHVGGMCHSSAQVRNTADVNFLREGQRAAGNIPAVAGSSPFVVQVVGRSYPHGDD